MLFDNLENHLIFSNYLFFNEQYYKYRKMFLFEKFKTFKYFSRITRLLDLLNFEKESINILSKLDVESHPRNTRLLFIIYHSF